MENKRRERITRRAAGIMLILCMILTMMPALAFADTQDNADTGQTTAAEASQEQTAEPSQPAAETVQEQTAEPSQPAAVTPAPAAKPAPRTAKSFKWHGTQVRFKTPVLIDEPLPAGGGPVKAMITGKKRSIKVSWGKAKYSSMIDGYIVLRKTAKEKSYTQIARVARGTTEYTDKTAKKKNTGYFYTVVGYKNIKGNIRISPCATWAAGMTTRSKHKNGYEAKMSRKSATLQSGEALQLKARFDKPKKIYNSGNIRWYSDNTNVVKVSKGRVTAVAPGTTTVRARLASGRDVTCKVRVVGAYKPGTPSLWLEYSTSDSIVLGWSKPSHAKKFMLYRSDDGGAVYNKISTLTGRTFTDKGLTEGKSYSYYVIAVNENGAYRMNSDKSAVLTQAAVKTPRRTSVTGFPEKASPKAGSKYSVKIKISVPDSRPASLQLYEDSKWVTKKSITLPAGIDAANVELTFPDTWWKKDKTTWRLYIPASDDGRAYTGGKLVLTTQRYYQNPKGYVQIRNKISTHGHDYYTSPVLVNNTSTKSEHIEAMIKTAYKYKGDRYVVCRSGKPGKGVDCSGLVMQACYGAGVDLWPSNPYRHRLPAYEYESRNIAKMSNLKTVPYKDRKRGDLIFYANSRGIVIHVAIYLGDNKIIHSFDEGVKITGMSYKYGHVCKVKRIFN